MAKKPPPSESATHPAMADSHLDLSTLISGTSFVNVDALTISPTAWTTSYSATAQRPPDEVQEDGGGGGRGSCGGGGRGSCGGGGGGGGGCGGVVAVVKCVGPTRNPTASAESSVSLSVLSLQSLV
jgi:hypothetical protein